MSCIEAHISLISTPVLVSLYRAGESVEASVKMVNTTASAVVSDITQHLLPQIVVFNPHTTAVGITKISEEIIINIGVICSINGEQILSFEHSVLSWSGEENEAGITKYNLLSASGDWILEEIEELL